jgi:hypothetical protein
MQPTDEAIAEVYLGEAENQLAKAASVIRHCLDQLNDEQLAWRPQPAMNSIGNLRHGRKVQPGRDRRGRSLVHSWGVLGEGSQSAPHHAHARL